MGLAGDGAFDKGAQHRQNRAFATPSKEIAMPSDLATRFHSLRSAAPFWSLRYHDERREVLAMRQDTIEPPSLSYERGAMLAALVEGGYGYCAPSDLSSSGLQQALDRATRWAEATRGKSVVRY